MIDSDSIFKTYSTEFVRNVPNENMRHLISIFMEEAAINMGCEVKKETIEHTIYYIQKDFSYIPVNYVAYAFIRGSLGKFGKEGGVRLVPKNIHYWLSEIAVEYNEYLAKEKIRKRQDANSTAMDLHKYPAGAAICKKIDWYRAGLIDMDDWDKISLKQVAEIIGRGQMPTLEMFNIKNKNG